MINALKKFRVYLLGRPVKIVTDCSAFEMTMRKVDVPAQVARWALQLSEYDYQLEHRPGTRMRHVDALSRYPVTCVGEMTRSDGITSKIRNAQNADSRIQEFKMKKYKGYVMKNV